MSKPIRKFSVRWFGAWLLILALLLSGCAGGQTSSGDDNPTTTSPDQTETEQTDADPTEESDQPVDYSKYNAYLEVVEGVYEMDGLLSSYFTVVQNQPEFALVEGMDYSMLEDAFKLYTFNAVEMDLALRYCDVEPDYPEQDELLTALDEPYRTMGGVLHNIADYTRFEHYLEDNLAQAPELHSKLYAALTAFDDAALPFTAAMEELDKATEQQELERLQSEGRDIAYYSMILFDIAERMDAEIWEQISQAQTETLPVLDMTNLESLYAEYQAAYTSLTAALADADQVAVQWPNKDTRDSMQSSYANMASNMDAALNDFMSAARSQGDYSESYDSYFSSVSRLIDKYNISI